LCPPQGAQRLHNFCADGVPHEAASKLFIKQFCHFGQAYYNNTLYLVLSVLADNLFVSTISRMVRRFIIITSCLGDN
jgi:hypothetical protein